jgi:hypothetical protein
MHHRLHAGSDRLETGQPQQVHCCGAQCAHRAGAIASVGPPEKVNSGSASTTMDLG